MFKKRDRPARNRLSDTGRLDNYARQQAALVHLSVNLAASLDETEVYGTLVNGLRDTLGYDNVGLFMVDESTGERVLRASVGWPDALLGWRLPRGQGVTERVLCDGQLHYIPDVTRDPDYEPGLGSGAEVDVPVVVGDNVAGVLVVESAQPNGFGQADFAVLTAAANQTSVALERARKHLAVKEAEGRYRSLFDGVPVGLYRTSPTGQFLDANPALVEMLGYPDRASLLSVDTAALYLNPEDRIEWESALEREIIVRGFEFQVRRYDGSVIWVRRTGRSVRDSDGRIICFEGSLEDVNERRRARTALRDSERRFRSVVETASDAVVSADSAGNIVFWNSAAERMFGYSAGEIIGEPFALMISEQFREAHRADLERVVSTGTMRLNGGTVETAGLKKDGTEFPVELSLATWKTKEGVFFTGIVRDITERKRVEQALKESEEKFRTLAEKSPNMIFINQGGRVLYANEACEEITGISQAEFYAPEFDFLSMIAPQSIQRVQEYFRRHMQGQEVPPYEYQVLAKDGTQIDGIHTSRLISYNGQRAILGIITDVTERKRAEDEIRRRNRELALLNRVVGATTSALDAEQVLQIVCGELTAALEVPGAAAIVLDPEGKEATVAAEHLASGRPGVLGKTICVADNPAVEHILVHNTPLAVADARTDKRLAPVHDLVGEQGIVSLLVVPLRVARGRIAGVLALATTNTRVFKEDEIALAQNVATAAGQALETARLYQALHQHAEDLEEMVAHRTAELRVALEQAQSADRLKSKFISNVSHELRTPLTNLKLYLSLLTSGRPEKRDIYQEILHREAGRLQNLIEDLLDLSRLDLGKTQAYLKATDVNLLVGTLAADRAALVADRGLRLDAEPDEELPLALADNKLLEQVLSNLLTNAINYTPAGGEVTLRTGALEAEGRHWVTLSVSDTGPGITEEDRAHLFERFHRGQAGLSSDAPGTGLGLAICQEIIKLHGGRIVVESAVGQGSTFSVWLPIA